MMFILLVVMGGLFALLFILNSLLRAAQAREKVSFFETLLAFLALILPLLALVNNDASEHPMALVNTATIGIGVVVIVASIITLLIELRQRERPLNQRRGILGIGVGVLLAVSTFVAPTASRLVVPPSAAGVGPLGSGVAPSALVNASDTRVPADRGTPLNMATAGSRVAAAPTATPNATVVMLSATPTRLPSATPTATDTPFVVASVTPDNVTGTPEANTARATGCWALVNWNLNLRTGPGRGYRRLLTIPYNTSINVSGRNEDATWWFVTYQTDTGWVDGQYVMLSGSCDDLPVREAP